MKRLLVPVALAMLAASCSSEIDELKTFVRDSEKGLPRRIDPLPPVKPFEPFTYEGFDLPDPFKPRKLTPPKEGGKRPGSAKRPKTAELTIHHEVPLHRFLPPFAALASPGPTGSYCVRRAPFTARHPAPSLAWGLPGDGCPGTIGPDA